MLPEGSFPDFMGEVQFEEGEIASGDNSEGRDHRYGSEVKSSSGKRKRSKSGHHKKNKHKKHKKKESHSDYD